MPGIEKDYRCRKEAGRVGPSAGVDHRVSAPLVKQDADDHDAPPDLLAPNAMTSLSGVGEGGARLAQYRHDCHDLRKRPLIQQKICKQSGAASANLYGISLEVVAPDDPCSSRDDSTQGRTMLPMPCSGLCVYNLGMVVDVQGLCGSVQPDPIWIFFLHSKLLRILHCDTRP